MRNDGFTKEQSKTWSKLWVRATRGKQDAASIKVREWQAQYEELIKMKENILKEFS